MRDFSFLNQGMGVSVHFLSFLEKFPYLSFAELKKNTFDMMK
jgi:hypothetical protein